MITVLIPAYNEEAILESSVKKLHSFLTEKTVDHEILVISNGSTDRTEEIGKRLEKEYPWFRILTLPKRSVGRAFELGVKEARNEDVISIDADLSSDLNFIVYAQELLHRCDMVVGSKTLGRQFRSILRVAGSQLYIFFVQYFFELALTDFSMSCKAVKRSAALPALSHLDSWTGYILELCLYMRLKGKKIVQIGVDCNDRRKSRFSLTHEVFYRYAHLYRTWRKLRENQSWFQLPSS
jgi:glycosyltransferase involved in cell wall biosynthesis